MLWFCRFNANQITFNTFEKHYKDFESMYLGYSLDTVYFFQSDFLDKLFDKWLKDNGKIDDNGKAKLGIFHQDSFNAVPMSQKVLECLALNGPSTFEQIDREINAEQNEELSTIQNMLLEEVEGRGFAAVDKRNDIKNVLQEYTLSENYVEQIRNKRYEKYDESNQ